LLSRSVLQQLGVSSRELIVGDGVSAMTPDTTEPR
jgi:hypothetical protein